MSLGASASCARVRAWQLSKKLTKPVAAEPWSSFLSGRNRDVSGHHSDPNRRIHRGMANGATKQVAKIGYAGENAGGEVFDAI